jgi:N-methylhydantoinase A
VEAASLRLRAEARAAAPLDFRALKLVKGVASAPSGPARPVHFGRDGPVLTPVIAREAVNGPMRGPLIVEAPDTTIVIPPGARVAPNGTGGLIAVLEGP